MTSQKEPKTSELNSKNNSEIGGDVSQSTVVAGNNNVINIGKPDRKRQVSKEQKRSKKIPVGIAGALIAATATIIASILNSPLLLKYFYPDVIQLLPSAELANTEAIIFFTPTINNEMTSTPTQQIQLPQYVTDEFNVVMAFVPAGDFFMGNDNGRPDERPFTEFYLNSFYIDKYEVTNALYKICVKNSKCSPPPKQNPWYDQSNYAHHPVMWTNWSMAKSYCEWRGARLPTEAEWEKTARSTDGRKYPWGNELIDCRYANHRSINGYCVGSAGGSTPVGTYEKGKSIYGVYDLLGNAVEWVSSVYNIYPYDSNDGRENLDSIEIRVLRGGSWNNRMDFANSITRTWSNPSEARLDYGFRCAKSAP